MSIEIDKKFSNQRERPRLGTLSNKIERNPNGSKVELAEARDVSRTKSPWGRRLWLKRYLIRSR